VQLGRWRDEPANEGLRCFYEGLLSFTNHDVFHAGRWQLLDVHPAGDSSSADLLAWQWVHEPELRIVVVNLGEGIAQGLVALGDLPGDLRDDSVLLEDQLDGRLYPWSRRTLSQNGLYVRLTKGAAHIFRVAL